MPMTTFRLQLHIHIRSCYQVFLLSEQQTCDMVIKSCSKMYCYGALLFQCWVSRSSLCNGGRQGWPGLRGLKDAVVHGVVSDGGAIQQHHGLHEERSPCHAPAHRTQQSPVQSVHAASVSSGAQTAHRT